ncbi:MAG: hypothetical protein V2I54_08860 [Bacteroidales bacterium]|jgi:hypothetical protein|nr:hypothetical protein [Bacteroidales bacterium]
MKAFSKFLIKEAILTATLGVASLILFQTILKTYYHPVFWLNLVIIAVLTGGLHFSVLKAGAKEHSRFSVRFISISGIKMMIYLVYIVLYAFLNPEHAKFFLITFLLLYFIYTFFEVFLILRFLHQD